MKRFFVLFFLLLTFHSVMAEEVREIADDTQTKLFYNIDTNVWSEDYAVNDNHIVITKKIIDSASSYIQLFYPDESLALTLASDLISIRKGVLVGINNNELRFSKIVYEDGYFEEIPITALEVQKLFPETEVVRLSLLDSDNKMWLEKPFFKKKDFLFVNDSNKSYYKLTPKFKKIQKSEIKCMFTIPCFGMFTLTHFGERNGKIRIYVR